MFTWKVVTTLNHRMSWTISNIFAGLSERWKSNKSKSRQQLNRQTKQPLKRQVDRLEDIRLAMLDMLGDEGARQYPGVVRRIHLSGDAQALWYARADLMAALAGLHGEQVAGTRMTSLSVLFDGMLPKGLMSRPTTLRANY